MNVPLGELIRRNKRVRENSTDEEDIPLDELQKRIKLRHKTQAEMENGHIRSRHNQELKKEMNLIKRLFRS